MKLANYFFKDIPLAKKLTIFCVISCLSSLLIAMSVVTIYDRHTFERIIKDELSAVATIIANNSVSALSFDDEEHGAKILATLSTISNVSSACIYRLDQMETNLTLTTRLASYPNENTHCPSRATKELIFFQNESDTVIELIQPITNDGEYLGYLYLSSDASELNQVLYNHFRVVAVISLVIILLLLWSANKFFNIISKPLDSLHETAKNVINKDDFSVRAEKLSNDEIGRVVDSFNKMLDVLQDEDIKIRNSEEKFRMISSLSKVGIFQSNMNGDCIYANQELCSICGLDENEIILNNWTSVVHPDDRAVVHSKFLSSVETLSSTKFQCRLLVNSEVRWINCYVDIFKQTDGGVIGYLGTINDVTDVKTAQVQLEHMAFYDTLTGLANRRLFRNRLEHVIQNLNREGSSLGLILLDLDHFKNVNDSLGHDAGDSLLTIIAERLQTCVRASDTVARLGGDEFAIILPGIRTTLAASAIAEKILKTLKEPIILLETEVRISVSAGIAMAPEDSDNAETLIKHADLALYRAKDKGRDEYQFFTKEMNTALIDHLNLVKELRYAIDDKNFNLVYQPLVRFDNGKIIGFEALIRWNHETRGLISPMDFIPVAEETGLIIPLGRWVISKACSKLHQLYEDRLVTTECSITVNLSAKQFQDEGLVDFIASQLAINKLKPSQFEIELTETALMENLDNAIYILESIKRIGVSISIDDFGTGYSSLGYLKQLPVNIVKVDRSFVTDIPNDKDDMEITAAVIAMAHNLRYQVVAEGVETQEQVDFLKQCHCDFGQGYFFSKPLTDEQLNDYCKEASSTDDSKSISL